MKLRGSLLLILLVISAGQKAITQDRIGLGQSLGTIYGVPSNDRARLVYVHLELCIASVDGCKYVAVLNTPALLNIQNQYSCWSAVF